MKHWKTLAVALAISSSAFAKPPTIPLNCGKIPEFKSEAERQYLDKASGGGNIYNVNITYIGKRPSNKQLNTALRNCLDVAIKKDGSKDILATAWIRRNEGANPADDDELNPYGGMKYISYSASKKNVIVQDVNIK